MKINCKVGKLMIVTKKITNFNVISFTATTTCSLLEFQKPFEQQINKWCNKSCNKSRSFISLQHMHSIEVGITVQGEDLNQLRFSCLLEFTSFSSSSLLLLLSSGNSIGFNSSSLYSGSPTWPNKKSSLLILEPPLSKLPSALIWRKGFYVHQRWSSKSQYVLSVSYLQEWYHHFLCDFKNCWLWPLYFGNGFIKKIISNKCCYFGLNYPFSKYVLAFNEAVQSNLYI